MERDKKVALIVCNLILGLIQTMDKQEQHKGSTIAYTTMLRKYIHRIDVTRKESEVVHTLCSISLEQLVEKFKEQEMILQVATFVESLSFSFEKELIAFCGEEYMVKMMKFTDKQIVISDVARDSYVLSDTLKDTIRKVIFDNLQKKGK